MAIHHFIVPISDVCDLPGGRVTVWEHLDYTITRVDLTRDDGTQESRYMVEEMAFDPDVNDFVVEESYTGDRACEELSRIVHEGHAGCDRVWFEGILGGPQAPRFLLDVAQAA